MSSVIASVAAAAIGLIGSILAFQNSRFSGPLDRANRIESLSKTLETRNLDKYEAYALWHVRHQLILDEHYKQFGPKLYLYSNALAWLNAAGGAVGVANIVYPFLGENVNRMVQCQFAVVIAICIIAIVQNFKHDKYIKKHGENLDAK